MALRSFHVLGGVQMTNTNLKTQNPNFSAMSIPPSLGWDYYPPPFVPVFCCCCCCSVFTPAPCQVTLDHLCPCNDHNRWWHWSPIGPCTWRFKSAVEVPWLMVDFFHHGKTRPSQDAKTEDLQWKSEIKIRKNETDSVEHLVNFILWKVRRAIYVCPSQRQKHLKVGRDTFPNARMGMEDLQYPHEWPMA